MIKMFKTIREANNFVKSHGTPLSNGQVKLTKPLFVFKKVYERSNSSHSIANLVIPIGAVVNLAEDCSWNPTFKMRASQAYCHSIATKHSKKQIKVAESGHRTSFVYHSGIQLGLKDSDFKNIVENHEKYIQQYLPKTQDSFKKCKCVPDAFDTASTRECSTGIHFFLDLQRALDY